MKDSNDIIGNRSSDLPVFSAVPPPLLHTWGSVQFFELKTSEYLTELTAFNPEFGKWTIRMILHDF
jgi:hypothetical protein